MEDRSYKIATADGITQMERLATIHTVILSLQNETFSRGTKVKCGKRVSNVLKEFSLMNELWELDEKLKVNQINVDDQILLTIEDLVNDRPMGDSLSFIKRNKETE